MGTLAISAANLNTLENNMVVLNDNINAVTSDIININGQMTMFNKDVNDMKADIKSLEEEIREFMADIRGTTLVSNAQNDILLKENELNKKYGNHDVIRRQICGLLESININLVRKSTLATETEKVLFNAPNYYLSYALIAISAWFNNDRKKANSALNEALKLNPTKTSLLLCLVHLKLGREETAFKWIKKYLDLQNPRALNNDFINVVDAITTGVYSEKIADLIYEKLCQYAKELKEDELIVNNQLRRWETFFSRKKATINDEQYIYLTKFTNNYGNIRNALINAKSYYEAYEEFNKTLDNVKSTKAKDISDLIREFVSSYETKELELKKDILKDNLIIKNNGNLNKADELFKDSNLAYDSESDFFTLMSNVLLERNDVSSNTKKLATSFLKDIIKDALSHSLDSSENTRGVTTISINEWTGSTVDGSNENELKTFLLDHVKRPYDKLLQENTFFDVKVILAVLASIAGLVIAIGLNFIAGIVVIIISLIMLFLFANEILKKRESIEKEFSEVSKEYSVVLENIIAEVVDTHFTVKRASENYGYMIDYLNKFDEKTYVSKR